MIQSDPEKRRCLQAVLALTFLLGIGGGFPAAPSCCCADDAALSSEQQAQLRLSDLEWALAIGARDDQNDPIRATHHFYRAAQAARLAKQESRVTSYLIAASFTGQAQDRSLIHPVRGAVFSPDSTWLLTYNKGPIAWLWEAGQSEPLRSFRHENEILAATFNAAATRILSHSRDHRVRLWDTQQTEALAILLHAGEVTGAKFTADEQRILSWSKDATARIWDPRHPERPQLTFQHDGPVTGAVFNADETKLLTSGDDNTARLWDARSGRLIHKLLYTPLDHLDAELKTTITNAAFCDNDSHISFHCYDGTYFWDVNSGKSIASFGRIFTGDRPRFITQSRGVVEFYDEPEGMAVRTFRHGLDVGQELEVCIAEFNKDRTRFLTKLGKPAYGQTHYGWVQLWESGGEKPLLTGHHDGIINGAAFAKHSEQILTYSQDGTARLWDIRRGHTPRTIRHGRSVIGALLSPNEKLLLTWVDSGAARLTDLDHADRGQSLGRLRPEYPGHVAWTRLPPNGLRAVTWGAYENVARYVDLEKNVRTFTINRDVDQVKVSPDGSHIFVMGTNQGGWLWNLNEDQLIASFEARLPVIFNSDASQVFFGTKEGGQLYDLKRRKTVKEFRGIGDREAVAHVAFTTAGIRVFVRGLNRLCVWDIDGKTPLRTFERDRRITEFKFSDDGQRVLTWHDPQEGQDNVYLWDANHSEPRCGFRHDDDFARAVFSPDASRILSWSNSPTGSARLWDSETGKVLTTFRRHGDVSNARFTLDGQRVLTITWDNKAHLFDPHQDESLRSFQHAAGFTAPTFADNDTSLIAQGGEVAMRWSIAVDRQSAIEQLQRNYEIKTATRLDNAGRLVPLSLEEWQRLRDAKGSR